MTYVRGTPLGDLFERQRQTEVYRTLLVTTKRHSVRMHRSPTAKWTSTKHSSMSMADYAAVGAYSSLSSLLSQFLFYWQPGCGSLTQYWNRFCHRYHTPILSPALSFDVRF